MEIPYIKKPAKTKLDMRNMRKQAAKYVEPEPVPSKLNMQQFQYKYNIGQYLRQFSDIDNLSDAQMAEMVKNSYIFILDASNEIKATADNNLADNEIYCMLISLFMNQRFILILNNVIRSTGIDMVHRRYLNRIIYNYLLLPTINKNQITERALIDLSITANQHIIPVLLGRGMDRDFAARIAICGYSSDNTYLCIRRVNCCMFNQAACIKSLQTVVDIYQYLFGGCVTKLFEGVMFDVYSRENLAESSEAQQLVYSYMGLAVLNLLNSMPLSSIRLVLISYAGDYCSKPSPVRFTMSLSEDFCRINEVIRNLEAMDGITLP